MPKRLNPHDFSITGPWCPSSCDIDEPGTCRAHPRLYSVESHARGLGYITAEEAPDVTVAAMHGARLRARAVLALVALSLTLAPIKGMRVWEAWEVGIPAGMSNDDDTGDDWQLLGPMLNVLADHDLDVDPARVLGERLRHAVAALDAPPPKDHGVNDLVPAIVARELARDGVA